MTQIRSSSVCREASQGCYSNLKPLYFSESLLRVYTKKAELAEIIQEGYNAILENLHEKYESGQGRPSPIDANDSAVPRERAGEVATPLVATMVPTTPKAPGSGLHSRSPSLTFPSGVVATPFARNKFTEIRKIGSASPPRTGTAMWSESAPIPTSPTSPTPNPAAGKRKRATEFEVHHHKEISQKSKKKR